MRVRRYKESLKGVLPAVFRKSLRLQRDRAQAVRDQEKSGIIREYQEISGDNRK